MAAGRGKSVELVKLLHAAAQPLYLLAEGRRLVFCNQSLLDWVGHSAEELLGKCCTYHSDPELTGVEAVVAGLCPPPEVLAGRETTGVVARTTPEGDLVRRRARFVPLRGAGDTIAGLLAILETDDLAEVEAAWPASEESEAAWLHERLRTHHRQMAAKLRSDRLVGESLAMRRIRAQAAVAAETKASVLILGPPGSGRQRIAGAIHYAAEPAPAGSLVPWPAAAQRRPDLLDHQSVGVQKVLGRDAFAEHAPVERRRLLAGRGPNVAGRVVLRQGLADASDRHRTPVAGRSGPPGEVSLRAGRAVEHARDSGAAA